RGSMARLSDPWLAQYERRSVPRARARRLAQQTDLALPADQRLTGKGGEHPRQRHARKRDRFGGERLPIHLYRADGLGQAFQLERTHGVEDMPPSRGEMGNDLLRE